MKSSRNVFTREFKHKCVKLVLEQGYDVVTAFDVMEHVPHDEIPVFLNEIYRVAKPNTTVIFWFPNCQSPAGFISQFVDHTHVSMLSGPLGGVC
jgi:2-polyprenyl-3-methyl-5-hydroxy-6-metoxy-1,4-benzoquinol methylase